MKNKKKTDERSENLGANALRGKLTPNLSYARLKPALGRDDHTCFDLDEISWVTEGVGVTDEVGASLAHNLGYYVINTAEEIFSPANAKVVIDPWTQRGNVKKSLNEISDLIERSVNQRNRKVVVHCYLGLERSVLAVAWYLHTKKEMTLDEAYELIRVVRPVILDRRHWVQGNLLPDENVMETEKLSLGDKQ